MKNTLLACVIALLTAAVPGLAAPYSSSKQTDMAGALTDLTLAAANHGYRLVKVQTMDSALVKRGYADPGVRVAFIGKSEQVEQAMVGDPSLLTLLPMKITLVREGSEIRITSDDLSPWQEQMPASKAVLQGWERDLAAIVADYAVQ